MTFPLSKSALPTAVAVLAFALCGCSSKSTSTPEPSSSSKGQAASQVCGSLLSGGPASALERITGSRHFTESSLSLDEKVRSLSEAKQKLLGDSSFEHRGKEFDLCLPVATDELTGGQLTISAQWIKVRTTDHTWKSTNGWTVFDIVGDGERDVSVPYASAASDTSLLDFRCPVGPGREKNTAISVVIATYKLNRNPDTQAPEDLTRIGYGVAVKLAKQMNCLQGSKLPTTLGNFKKFA
ncbi:hypothetical protein R6V09_19250 [Streptomyces sp. W16]|uniref:hypothetical protein n=1 Tax=Streptomyces sp. W16 TaxID=3076631 RepID=UPI00295B1F66|nr:hypothetical protein [Streptomyces sp. W16]MDV9172236.1 hypothetical protein [Streptomyces sp. W16]